MVKDKREFNQEKISNNVKYLYSLFKFIESVYNTYGYNKHNIFNIIPDKYEIRMFYIDGLDLRMERSASPLLIQGTSHISSLSIFINQLGYYSSNFLDEESFTLLSNLYKDTICHCFHKEQLILRDELDKYYSYDTYLKVLKMLSTGKRKDISELYSDFNWDCKTNGYHWSTLGFLFIYFALIATYEIVDSGLIRGTLPFEEYINIEYNLEYYIGLNKKSIDLSELYYIDKSKNNPTIYLKFTVPKKYERICPTSILYSRDNFNNYVRKAQDIVDSSNIPYSVNIFFLIIKEVISNFEYNYVEVTYDINNIGPIVEEQFNKITTMWSSWNSLYLQDYKLLNICNQQISVPRLVTNITEVIHQTLIINVDLPKKILNEYFTDPCDSFREPFYVSKEYIRGYSIYCIDNLLSDDLRELDYFLLHLSALNISYSLRACPTQRWKGTNFDEISSKLNDIVLSPLKLTDMSDDEIVQYMRKIQNEFESVNQIYKGHKYTWKSIGTKVLNIKEYLKLLIPFLGGIILDKYTNNILPYTIVLILLIFNVNNMSVFNITNKIYSILDKHRKK